MKQKTTIKKALTIAKTGDNNIVQGWVKNIRISKQVAFIMLQDGSSQQPLQIVVEPAGYPKDFLNNLHVGSSLTVEGTITQSQGKEQAKEMLATKITLIGPAPPDAYPLQPKHHTLAFLRTIQHLRFRTNFGRAISRLRHISSHAIHEFFHKKDFYHIHTPIITSLDTEGAGELFKVQSAHKTQKTPFFGLPTYLTVSGQLAAEAACSGLGKVYTFGPTFRAENSHTTRHLAEFWMVEPEIAFCDLQGAIALAKEMLKYLIGNVLKQGIEELAFLEKHADSTAEKSKSSLSKQLERIHAADFIHITYDQAFQLLKKAHTKKRFAYPMDTWGKDLQTEHERYLTSYFDQPVVVTDYPKEIKPFYMRENEDGKTVGCMDVLLPGIGEIIGGSEREERFDKLLEAARKHGLKVGDYGWYFDLRRFGTFPHAGFGLGFDRFVQYITGASNIRDVIPFPRTPGHAAC